MADIQAALAQTRAPDARTRRAGIRALCPCDVKSNEPAAWDRLLEMAADPDAGVRSAVLHALCDGSPNERQPEVVAALEALAHDDEPRIRRRARGVLAEYRRTGRVNVL